MLANLVRSIFPNNSSENFEKARILATYDGDTNPPQEKDLSTILLCFKGKNPEIKGTTAFYLTTANMQANNKTKSWNYILKNFILFDRAIDEKCFAKEISELEIEQIGNYKQVSGKHGEKLDLFLKRYFRYIKAKGRVYNTKHLQFNHLYGQKKRSLEALPHEQLLLENKKLKSLIVFAFDIFQTEIQEITKYKLNQYIFLLIVNALVKILSLQYILLVIIVENLSVLEYSKANELYQAFRGFIQDIDLLMSRCADLKGIIDLELSREQIYDPHAGLNIIQMLKNYIETFNKAEQPPQNTIKYLNIPNYDLSTKAQGISLTPFMEAFVPQHKGDDQITEVSIDFKGWNEDAKAADKALTPLCPNTDRPSHSPTKYNSRARTPKSISKTFRDSFSTGFSLAIKKDELDIKYKNDKREIKINNSKGSKGVANKENQFISKAFADLLCITEQDEMFEKHNNFYSHDFSDKVRNRTNEYVTNTTQKKNLMNFQQGAIFQEMMI